MRFKTLKACDSRTNIEDIKDEFTQEIEQATIELNNIVLQKLQACKPSGAKKLEDVFPATAPKSLLKLIDELLNLNPNKRLSAEEAL